MSVSLKSLLLNMLHLFGNLKPYECFFYFIAFVGLGICFMFNLNYVSLHLYSVIELTASSVNDILFNCEDKLKWSLM